MPVLSASFSYLNRFRNQNQIGQHSREEEVPLFMLTEFQVVNSSRKTILMEHSLHMQMYLGNRLYSGYKIWVDVLHNNTLWYLQMLGKFI